MIKHIFKDGSTKEELKNVYIPKELLEQVISIKQRKGGKKCR